MISSCPDSNGLRDVARPFWLVIAYLASVESKSTTHEYLSFPLLLRCKHDLTIQVTDGKSVDEISDTSIDDVTGVTITVKKTTMTPPPVHMNQDKRESPGYCYMGRFESSLVGLH